MRLDQHVHRFAYCFAHGTDQSEGLPEFRSCQVPVGSAERVELERRIAALGNGSGGLGVAVRISRPRVPAVRVSAYPRARHSAQQAPDGDAERFGAYVPTSHLDTGHGRVAVKVNALEHVVPERPHIEWVLADNDWTQLLDLRHVRLRVEPARRFPQAGHPFIGAHLHEDPVLPGVAHDECLQFSDNHRAARAAASSSSSRSGATSNRCRRPRTIMASSRRS